MSFETAAQSIRDLIRGGAWWAMGRIYGGPADYRAALTWMEGYYGRLGGYTPNQLAAFIERYQDALDAAASLRRRPINPVPEADIPGYPGLEAEYQFHVMQTFIDPETGASFNRLFKLNSSVNLNRAAVMAAHQQAVADYLNDREYVSAYHGEADWQRQASGQIVAVIKRIP